MMKLKKSQRSTFCDESAVKAFVDSMFSIHYFVFCNSSS